MSWLPNLFSIARLILAPFIVRDILARNFRPALLLCAAAGITDGIDGWLARRFGWSSRAGAYLDPIADKVLLDAVWIALAMSGSAPWWLAGLVLGRDLLILLFAAGALLFTRLRSFPPSFWGKLSTCVQIGAAVVILAGIEWPVVFWLTAIATAWSGLDYLRRGIASWRGSHQGRLDA